MKAIITIEDSDDKEFTINTTLELVQKEGEEFTQDSALTTGATIAAYLMDILNDPDIANKVDDWIKERFADNAA